MKNSKFTLDDISVVMKDKLGLDEEQSVRVLDIIKKYNKEKQEKLSPCSRCLTDSSTCCGCEEYDKWKARQTNS